MTSAQITNVNALAELENIKWPYEPIGDDEVKVKCPAHDDQSPSVTLNTRKNIWQCWASHCRAKGDIITFLAMALKTDRKVMTIDLSKRYDLEDQKTINPDVAEKFHSQVWNAGPLLTALRDRGVTDEMIRSARLGYHDGRVTIPIYTRTGSIVDVLRYLPGAPGNKKMRHTRGYGKLRMYRPRDLKHGTIWIFGGVIKALVAGTLLNEHDVGAVSTTGGEGSWNHEWSSFFKDKRVIVCMDVDAAGIAAANRIADSLAAYAADLRVVQLPLDKTKYPKGDVNDYVASEKKTAEDLIELAKQARQYEPPQLIGEVEKGSKGVKLRDVGRPENIGWRLNMDGVCLAMDETPYLVPRKVSVFCTRDQPLCHQCPIKREDPDERGFVDMEIAPTSQSILSMVSSSKDSHDKALRDGLGIPRCKTVEFTTLNHHRVTDARLGPQLSISGDGVGNIMQPALLVGSHVDLNVPYELSGRVYPHPASQKATLVINEFEETEDSLDSFSASTVGLDPLKTFRPTDWTVDSIREKLDSIYADLSANVTRIFGRDDLHLVVDLTYHSPLLLSLGGREINGWVNTLVAGDSSQGKSETTSKLMAHYGLGERVECKNATVAGLMGGLQQLGNRWFVSWGVIPVHDRRLVILEEVKGAPVEVVSKLTDMRSSGIAEIPKIERRKALARTRLIFVSNPRGSRPISAYSFGVEALYELIGSLEDLRRFDLAITVASGQVPVEKMHSNPDVTHEHTAELCRRLILWGWTRKREQVLLGHDTERMIRAESERLCGKYSEKLPLVDRGTTPHKLARLAAALAVRTFSTDESMENVEVHPAHVEYVSHFIDKLYSDASLGYDKYSLAQRTLDAVKHPDKVRRYLMNTRHPEDLVQGLLHRDDITLTDLQDWSELDRDGAGGILSFLVRMHALRRVGRSGYEKTPEFIELLREMDSTMDQYTEELDDEEF